MSEWQGVKAIYSRSVEAGEIEFEHTGLTGGVAGTWCRVFDGIYSRPSIFYHRSLHLGRGRERSEVGEVVWGLGVGWWVGLYLPQCRGERGLQQGHTLKTKSSRRHFRQPTHTHREHEGITQQKASVGIKLANSAKHCTDVIKGATFWLFPNLINTFWLCTFNNKH